MEPLIQHRCNFCGKVCKTAPGLKSHVSQVQKCADAEAAAVGLRLRLSEESDELEEEPVEHHDSRSR